MDLDLHLDLMEFPGRLIGLPFVNGFYFGSVSLLGFRSFPIFLSLLSTGYLGLGRISGPSFVFPSLPPFVIGLFTLFGTPWAKGGVLARDLARWLLWRMGACSPHQSKAAGIRPVACSPHVEEEA